MPSETAATASSSSVQSFSSGRRDLPTWAAVAIALASISLGAFLGMWTVLGALAMAAGAAVLWRSHRVGSLAVLASWVAVSLFAISNF